MTGGESHLMPDSWPTRVMRVLADADEPLVAEDVREQLIEAGHSLDDPRFVSVALQRLKERGYAERAGLDQSGRGHPRYRYVSTDAGEEALAEVDE